MKNTVFNLQLFTGAYEEAIDRTGAAALIPEETSKEILQEIPKYSAIMQVATRLPDMSRSQKNLPVLNSLPSAYFVYGDTGLKQTSKAEWANKTLVAEELAVIIPIPEAVLEDSDYDIWGQIKPLILQAMGAAFDRAVLYGINAPSSWPTDILTAATAALKVVTIGTGEDLYEDVLGENGVISLIEADGYMATGHIGAMAMRGKLRSLRDANGVPLFKTGIQGATSYELDGAPMFFPENNAIDATRSLMFSGNFRKLVYAIRKDITYKILSEAVIQDGAGEIVYNLAQQDMVALRAVMRLAWQIPNPVNPLNTGATRYPIGVLIP